MHQCTDLIKMKIHYMVYAVLHIKSILHSAPRSDQIDNIHRKSPFKGSKEVGIVMRLKMVDPDNW